jgi:cytidylate kinase
MPHLVVIYGPPLAGKSSLARQVAAALGDKAALVSTDAILQEAIQAHDPDVYAELEMVHTQARLLVANFLKNRYHVVLEGAFYYEVGGVLHRHEQEIDQTVSLMRNIAQSPLVVRVGASAVTLQQRAGAATPPRDAGSALRIEAAYKPRSGDRFVSLSTDDATVPELAGRVLERLADA